MPVGLMVMFWDERMGAKIVAKYPEEISVSLKTLMQIFSTHEYSEDVGMINLMLGHLNIASYYTGPDLHYYVLLILDLDEDADLYEEALADVSRYVIYYLKDKKEKLNLSMFFKRISAYPSLNKEQLNALAYQEEIRRMITNRLRDEGMVSKSELSIWLRDKFLYGFLDLDAIISDLNKKNIIKGASVKGTALEYIFLTKIITVIRIPPIDLYHNPVKAGLPKVMETDYRNEIKKHFQKYIPSEQDSVIISEILTDPQCYEVLKLLRKYIVKIADLEKLKQKGVVDINSTLEKMYDAKVIQVFEDNVNKEYITLMSDVRVNEFFPKYILNTVIKSHNNKTKADPVLIEYLNILESSYLQMNGGFK